MNRKLLEQLLYEDDNEKILKKIKEIDDEKTLFVFSYNYNWNNGFQIPSVVLQNKNCTLSVALMLFYNADGLDYLQNKIPNDSLPEWSVFIEILYKNILEKKYDQGEISFQNPLTKVQLFKLKKMISIKDEIFVNNISGEDGCILI